MLPHARTLLGHLRRLAPSAASDAALLAGWVGRRDEDAFAALVARHGPMVLGVCRRVLGDAQHAEDAFQATVLVLARRAAHLRRPEALASFLYGTALRLARKARARRWSRGAPSDLPGTGRADAAAGLLPGSPPAGLQQLQLQAAGRGRQAGPHGKHLVSVGDGDGGGVAPTACGVQYPRLLLPRRPRLRLLRPYGAGCMWNCLSPGAMPRAAKCHPFGVKKGCGAAGFPGRCPGLQNATPSG
jgi:hypothetical protein